MGDNQDFMMVPGQAKHLPHQPNHKSHWESLGGHFEQFLAVFSGFKPFFGHFKGTEWCQTKIPCHATPAERSPIIAERICGFWFQGSFVQIMAHCALLILHT